MTKIPHPFTQQPADHPGWDRKHFQHQGREWALLVINTPNEVRSSLWPMDADQRQPWPRWFHMQFDVLISVHTAATVISTVYRAYDEGLLEGAKGAKAHIRHVLGCAS